MAFCGRCGYATDADGLCLNRYCDHGGTAIAVEDGEAHVEDEAVKVRQWRFEQFSELGFVEQDASKLAASEADLHEAAHLVKDQGCPIEQAVEILA